MSSCDGFIFHHGSATEKQVCVSKKLFAISNKQFVTFMLMFFCNLLKFALIFSVTIKKPLC